MNPQTDIRKLFWIWDVAIDKWRADGAASEPNLIAMDAMSWGAYFEPLLEQDTLLNEIHLNFGLLESSSHDDDPDNSKLWAKQVKLIEKAKEKYRNQLS